MKRAAPTPAQVRALANFSVTVVLGTRATTSKVISFIVHGGPGFEGLAPQHRANMFKSLQETWNGKRVRHLGRSLAGTVRYVFAERAEDRFWARAKGFPVHGPFRAVVGWEDGKAWDIGLESIEVVS